MRLTQRLKPKARAARQRVVCWCWERCRVLSQHTTADVCGKLAGLPPLLHLHHMLLPPKAKVAAPQRPALLLHRAPKWVSCRGVWVTPTSHVPPTPHGLLLRCSAVLLLRCSPKMRPRHNIPASHLQRPWPQVLQHVVCCLPQLWQHQVQCFITRCCCHCVCQACRNKAGGYP